MSKGNWTKGVHQDHLAHLMLSLEPKTAQDLARISRGTYQNTKVCVLRLRNLGVVRIAGWVHTDPYHVAPLYALGSDPDVPRPPAKSKLDPERSKRYREQKLIKELEQVESRFEMDRARKAREALAQPAFRHWQDCALFGEYARALD